jgi:hypothetical protein
MRESPSRHPEGPHTRLGKKSATGLSQRAEPKGEERERRGDEKPKMQHVIIPIFVPLVLRKFSMYHNEK